MSSTDSTDSTAISNRIENFLAYWDRHAWMSLYGEWVSSEWDEARAEYNAAVEALAAAVDGLPCAERADGSVVDIQEAVKAVEEAAAALRGQVRPDEGDYITEGLIDPGEVADKAEVLPGGDSWGGWDCREGYAPYRVGASLYLNWWRQAWGDRRHRDLWVLVDSAYFEGEGGDE